MTDVAASYGFEIHSVPEGHRVTYQRLPIPSKVYVLSAILGIPMLLVTFFSFALGPICGFIPLLLFFVIVPIRLWILSRRRMASPTTFLITPSHLVVGASRYERAHIARFFIHE